MFTGQGTMNENIFALLDGFGERGENMHQQAQHIQDLIFVIQRRHLANEIDDHFHDLDANAAVVGKRLQAVSIRISRRRLLTTAIDDEVVMHRRNRTTVEFIEEVLGVHCIPDVDFSAIRINLNQGSGEIDDRR